MWYMSSMWYMHVVQLSSDMDVDVWHNAVHMMHACMRACVYVRIQMCIRHACKAYVKIMKVLELNGMKQIAEVAAEVVAGCVKMSVHVSLVQQ
jgi:hypothetical protein